MFKQWELALQHKNTFLDFHGCFFINASMDLKNTFLSTIDTGCGHKVLNNKDNLMQLSSFCCQYALSFMPLIILVALNIFNDHI